MEIADMHRLLTESKSSGKPIGCAVGMSKDMKTALLLLHPTDKGPEVGRNLKKDVPDVVNIRFGTARIDDEHANLVRLVLNRPVLGIARKLEKTLRGTGYTTVKLGLEDGTAFDGAEDEEEAEATGASASSAKTSLAMRQSVEDDMERLWLAIAGAYQNEPAVPAAAKTDERQKLVDEGDGITDLYPTYAAEPLLTDLDNNPFLALSLQASVRATLAEMAGAID
jgi:hypothetical protein